MKRFHAVTVVTGILLASCTITRHPELFPANDTAHQLGALRATLTGHGNLNGTMSLALPDGEVLTGRYSIAAGGGAGFGAVSGSQGFASGSAFLISAHGDGVADMIGPKGTTAHCEFANNNFSGHGSGACRLSSGAEYRMQY